MKRLVVACFSAGNLERMATNGSVIADNDESGTGLRVAQATGRPYWMSDVVGEDFNDFYRRVGVFRASQELKRWCMSAKEPVS